MILSKAICTLPEQKQIDLLNHCANTMCSQKDDAQRSIFQHYHRLSPNGVADPISDTELTSPEVIHAYLGVIESGIRYCETHNVPFKVLEQHAVVTNVTGWYEKDLAAIAASSRLTDEHIERAQNILRNVIELVQIAEFTDPNDRLNYGGMYVSYQCTAYQSAFMAFCANKLVDWQALSALLMPIMKRIELEQTLFETACLTGNRIEAIPLESDHCFLMRKIVDHLESTRADEPQVMNLLNELGRQASCFQSNFNHPFRPMRRLTDCLLSVKVKDVSDDLGIEKFDSQFQMRSAIAMLIDSNVLNGREHSEFLSLLASRKTALSDYSHIDGVFQCAIDVYFAITKRLFYIDSGIFTAENEMIPAYYYLLKTAKELAFELHDKGLVASKSKEEFYRTLFEISDALSSSKGTGRGELLSTIKDVIIKGCIDFEFIKSAFKDDVLKESYFNIPLRNPFLDDSQYIDFIEWCHNIYLFGPEAGESRKTSPVVLECLLKTIISVTLMKEVYPLLLDGQGIPPERIARLFELGIEFDLLDEEDLNLITKAGSIENICQQTSERFQQILDNRPGANELVVSLLLKERVAKADLSPNSIRACRPLL